MLCSNAASDAICIKRSASYVKSDFLATLGEHNALVAVGVMEAYLNRGRVFLASGKNTDNAISYEIGCARPHVGLQ